MNVGEGKLEGRGELRESGREGLAVHTSTHIHWRTWVAGAMGISGDGGGR